MATFDFTVPIYGFDQWSASASTNNTVSYTNGTTFTLNPGASLTVIDVTDDDGIAAGQPGNEFSDGFIDTPGDGSTPSTANNDQVLSQAVSINGQNFSAGDQVELEFAFTTTSGETFWVIRIDGQNVGISGSVLPTPGTTYEVNGNADGAESPIEDVPCFVDGAMVQTPNGVAPIEHLGPGDLVETLDHGAQPILWAGYRDVSAQDMLFFPHLRPIVIQPDALAANVPAQQLVISPNHRVLVKSAHASLYFASDEVFVAAKNLINGTTIFQSRRICDVRYRHLLLGRHEILWVNGAPTESLLPAQMFGDFENLLDLDLSVDASHVDAKCARPVLKRFEACLIAA